MNSDTILSTLLRMEQSDLDQRANNVSREQRWRSIPKETGRFLYQQVATLKPEVIVEIGMSHGYSTSWMGLAAIQYGGTIHAYEVEEWRYEQAINNFREMGLEDTIIPHLVEPDFSDYPNKIDCVFIDAEKSDYIGHIQNIENSLSEDGHVFADNTISHPDELAGYLDYVRSNSVFFSVGVPIGKGVEWTRKLTGKERSITSALSKVSGSS